MICILLIFTLSAIIQMALPTADPENSKQAVRAALPSAIFFGGLVGWYMGMDSVLLASYGGAIGFCIRIITSATRIAYCMSFQILSATGLYWRMFAIETCISLFIVIAIYFPLL